MKQKIEITHADAVLVCNQLSGVLRDLGCMSNHEEKFPGGPVEAVSLWRKERRYFVARKVRAGLRRKKCDALAMRDELDGYAATLARLVPLIAA